MHSSARLVLLALVVLLAACGGKAAPKSAPGGGDHDHAMGSAADGHDHDHAMGSATGGHDHHATGSASSEPGRPATPTEPTKPTEPAAPHPAQIKAALLAAEQTAFQNAKPVFDKFCAKCHTKTGNKSSQKKLDHFDMTTYPFGGHHAMELGGQIRKSLAIGGGKPTMPFDKKGAVKGDELALIATWADAFDKAHAAGAHDGAGHQHGHHDHKH